MAPRLVAIVPVPQDSIEPLTITDQNVFRFGRAHTYPVAVFTKDFDWYLWWKMPGYRNVGDRRNFTRRHNRNWKNKGYKVKRERIKIGNFILRPGFLPGDKAAVGIEYDGDIVPGSYDEAQLKTIISRLRSLNPEPNAMIPAPTVDFKGLPEALVQHIKGYASHSETVVNPLTRSRSRSRSGCCGRTKKKNK